MLPAQSTPIVNSYNEWDPLEEVIVGTTRGAVQSAYEPGLAPFFPIGSDYRLDQGGHYPTEDMDRAERQLDGLAETLEREGVTVHRPEPLSQDHSIKTPEFESPYGHGQTCPRDVLLVVGDEIIEAPMSHRSRFFEYRAYRPLLADYFRQGARWTAAPKPTMGTPMYVPDYETTTVPFDLLEHPNLTESEPCFDAACFMRMGRDIFWQPDIVSNQLGADWLQRHLGPDFNVHRVEFEHPHPHHIDTTLVPLRPGLVVVCPDRPPKRDCLKLFRDSGWEIVQAPRPIPRRKRSSPAEVSSWISLNVLSLNPQTVVVEESEEPFIEMLKSRGFDVITLPFRAVYPFGGGFHCATTDIRRSGGLESYF